MLWEKRERVGKIWSFIRGFVIIRMVEYIKGNRKVYFYKNILGLIYENGVKELCSFNRIYEKSFWLLRIISNSLN